MTKTNVNVRKRIIAGPAEDQETVITDNLDTGTTTTEIRSATTPAKSEPVKGKK
jgi:hypothetical protein